MLKRIIKRIRIERLIGRLIGAPPATTLTIIRMEWEKYCMRCRAMDRAVRCVS